MTGGRDDRPYYGRPRTVAAILLVIAAVVLMLIDAVRPDYAVDTIQLGLLLGTSGVLLGVDAIRKVVG